MTQIGPGTRVQVDDSPIIAISMCTRHGCLSSVEFCWSYLRSYWYAHAYLSNVVGHISQCIAYIICQEHRYPPVNKENKKAHVLLVHYINLQAKYRPSIQVRKVLETLPEGTVMGCNGIMKAFPRLHKTLHQLLWSIFSVFSYET